MSKSRPSYDSGEAPRQPSLPRSDRLTPSQKLATDPDISARVTANAGAGKTYVLTARVLRLLLKNVHPSKILCLTYTKAAAAEMRERIQSRLERWALIDDAELRLELAELIETEPSKEQMKIARILFSSILESSPPPRIQTIHSFCQDILKRFPLESGVEPFFEVADDVTAKELIRETTLRVLAAENASVKYIAAIAGEWKFNEVTAEIIAQRSRIWDLFEAAGTAEQLIAELYRKHGLEHDFNRIDLITRFFDFDRQRSASIKAITAALANSANVNDNSRGSDLYAAVVAKDFIKYSEIFLTKGYEPKQVKSIITKAGTKFVANVEEIIASEQDIILATLGKIILAENIEFTSHVISLSENILAEYDALKKSRALIDYNDLIYKAKKLLTTADNAAWVLYKLDRGIDHILVDEAQDTSPDQWQIILALLEEFMAGEGAVEAMRTIFIVGDEKQSIYSFQGADQKKFNEILNHVQQRCHEAGKAFSDLKLELSFRSVEAVLKLADNAFEPEHLHRSISSSITKISHQLHRIGEGGHVELWPLLRNEEKEEMQKWQLPLVYHTSKSADLLLAEKIAETIGNWLASSRKLASTGKAVRPGDIMILLRSRGNLADMLIYQLKRRKIPASGSDRLKITEHIAIQDLISLSKFLLLPSDDLSLAEVLKSPLFNVNEDELFELCYQRKRSLWSNLRDNGKFSEITNRLQHLLNSVDYISVYDLYSLVLDELHGRKKMLARLGQEVNDVIDEFLELAVSFERLHVSSLQHFIHWVELSSIELRRDMEESTDSEGKVRIMTVHGAKGLEAPVVFLADAAKMPKSKRQLLWHENHFYSYKTKERIFPALREIINNADADDYDEYLRLLYVAVTRARDELYICGSLGEKNLNIEKSWYQILENSIARFGAKDEINGVYNYKTAHRNELRAIAPKKVLAAIALPAYLANKVPGKLKIIKDLEEHTSMIESTESIDYGNRVHKILEIAAQLETGKRDLYLDNVFAADAESRAKIAGLFTNDNLKDIFGPDSRAEVPIIGELDGVLVTGRIDRMVIRDDKIIIADFKTSRRIPDIMPQVYIKQMDRYARLIQLQYPERQVLKYILWTNNGTLVQLA